MDKQSFFILFRASKKVKKMYNQKLKVYNYHKYD